MFLLLFYTVCQSYVLKLVKKTARFKFEGVVFNWHEPYFPTYTPKAQVLHNTFIDNDENAASYRGENMYKKLVVIAALSVES